MTFHKFLPFLAVASLTLAGCVSNEKQWVKDDTPQSESDQALAECKYQAESATIGIGSNTRSKSWGGAISDGIADGVVRGMDEQELIKDCMKAKGFAQ